MSVIVFVLGSENKYENLSALFSDTREIYDTIVKLENREYLNTL